MKISLDWLGDFLEWQETNPDEIARMITACTAEVDEVEKQGKFLDNCCVGKVLTISKHPDADKLKLCDVQTDQGMKRVVCGGTNLREGMRVAFAHVGATVLWHGEEVATLEKVKIRGEASEGMICAAEELGLEERFPESKEAVIIDMGDGDENVGTNLREALGMTDTVLIIDNHALTNRADLFSHAGFARECVAIGLAKWKKKPGYTTPSFPRAKVPFECTVECEDLVPLYNGCTISVDSIGETPDWMVQRLEATGWRSVSLPVDITNYVTMELGMPMHSFDMDDFKGGIVTRCSKKGEKITTLDGNDWELPEGSIVISDDEGIFDLLGMMGGLRSSTKESTKNIFLHAAILDPATIRRTIMHTGLRTEAATIYEKGVPYDSSLQGIMLALKLFMDLVPGTKITSQLISWGKIPDPKEIILSVGKTQNMLGVEVSEKRIVQILQELDFQVKSSKGDTMKVLPPIHRLGDIEGAHDLTEEVGRIHGYDSIEMSLPDASTVPPERDFRIHQVRDALVGERYYELLPLSLLGPDLLAQCNIESAGCVRIGNPLGEELSLMQPSVLPRMLEHAEKNLRISDDDLRTFTWGHVFHEDKEEQTELGVLCAPKAESKLIGESFFHVKQDLMYAMKQAGYEVTLHSANNPPAYAHPGRAAHLRIAKTDVGYIFELHPSVAARFDLPKGTAVALINISDAFGMHQAPKVAEPVPAYPSVVYDTTFKMSHSKSVGELLKQIRESSEMLESVKVVDIYSDKKSGDYSLTVRCTYRVSDRTLKEEELKEAHAKVEQLTP